MAQVPRNRELFYTGLLALTVLLPAPGFVLLAVSGDASGSLLARLLAPPTIGAMHASFVLLPVFIAFLAISLPAAVRAISKGRPPASELGRVGALFVAAGAYAVAGGAGLIALLSLVTVLGISALPAAPLLARMAPWFGPRAALLASACWLGVVWYQLDIVRGAEASYAIAPSLAVLAMALSVMALASATAKAAASPTPAWLRATMIGWSAIVAALLAPRIALLFPAGIAGHAEVGAGALAAVVGAAAAFLGRERLAATGDDRGPNPASRSAAPSHRVNRPMENS